MLKRRPIAEIFAEYGQYHQTLWNRRLHAVGIPLIVVTTFGLLGSRAGLALLVFALAWGFFRDLRLGLPFAFLSGAAFCVGQSMTTPVLWVGFILGWIFQGVGHAFAERKSPAFFKSVEQLLVGPYWLVGKLFGY